MFDSSYYSHGIKGEISAVDFDFLIPSKRNPFPDFKVSGFMVNGPYVLKTDGTLETEYLYERHKVLEEDYLKYEGGEHAIIPYIGLSHKNNYLGDKILTWTKGRQKWGTLRFDKEDYDACNDALFLTEQRNCAYYAAVYVDCKNNSQAVICYETSGSLLYLNGELIDNKPYGRVKGLWGFANMVDVRFNKGRNLLLLKVRTGYICDTIDITISSFTIFPIVAQSGNIGVCPPTKIRSYYGNKDNVRQILPTFICTLGKTDGFVKIKSGEYCESIKIESPEKGTPTVSVIRPSLPAEKGGVRDFSFCVKDGKMPKAVFEGKIDIDEFDGFCGKEHVYSDFHFDTTYHQEQRTYALGAIDILSKMLDKLRSNKDFKAILSEVDYLHPYYCVYPKDRKTLKEAFLSGRAEADCFYNQPNEMTSAPEGLVRNLVYGQLYHRDVLGRKAYVYGPGDVFGHPNQLSQLCKKGDCEGIYWGKHIFGLDCLFNHMSPDGTVLVHARGGTSRENALQLGITNANDSGRASYFTAYPREDDTSWMRNTISKAQFSVMSDFLGGVNEDAKKQKEETGESPLGTTSRDISLYHAGVALSRQDLKRANRIDENLLITAEKFAAIAAYFGAIYPEQALDKAWRQVLCGQHHDSITGTNNEISFVDLVIQYREAACLACDIIDNSLKFILTHISTFGSYPIVVFNPHAYKRRDICEIHLPIKPDKSYVMTDLKGRLYPVSVSKSDLSGKTKITFTPDVPALGYKVYSLLPARQENMVKNSDEASIENEFYRVTVDKSKGGGIVSVYDKKEKREIVDTQGGKIGAVYALKELRDRMETQHEFYTTGEKLSSAEGTASITRRRDNREDKLIIKSNMGILCTLNQEITLTKGVKRIDIRLTVEDYTGDDHLFTYNLPVNIKGGKAVFDDRFAPAVRPKSRNLLDFKTHQYAMASHCSVFAANQWFALGPTVRVSFGEKGAFNIGPVALISPDEKRLNNSVSKLAEALTKKAIPVTLYPDRKRKVRATLLPHFNDDLQFTDTRFVLSIRGINNEYEDKLLANAKNGHKRVENALKKNGVAVLYTRDDNNLWNKPIDVILIKARNEFFLSEFIDTVYSDLACRDSLTLKDCILCAKTETPDDYTVSILNRGNLASSVEADNSLNIMLFHTALFYGNSGKVTGRAELVPERKTHVFEFALYPHAKSFREGEEFIKALEYNDPLLGLAATGNSKNFLPEEKSFVSCSKSFVLTSFKAGGYPLASLKGNIPDISRRGFSLRGFEQNGVNAQVTVKFGFGISNAHSVNLLEEDPTDLNFTKTAFRKKVGAHSIETVTLKPANISAPDANAVLGADCESIKPSYIRSWEHSSGTMPFSYLRTVAVIDRKLEYIDDNSFKTNISVVNNRPDLSISGKLKLVLPLGFKSDKTVFNYSLESSCYKIFPITITKDKADRKGIILLYFNDGNNEFFDSLEVGPHNPSMSMKTDGDNIIVTVRNDTDCTLFGELALACPTECWGLSDKRSDALCSIEPFSHKVNLKPNSHYEYIFTVKQEQSTVFNAYWACAKLMINGKVYYSYAKKSGKGRNLKAHEFVSELTNNQNSQKAYLTLKDGMCDD